MAPGRVAARVRRGRGGGSVWSWLGDLAGMRVRCRRAAEGELATSGVKNDSPCEATTVWGTPCTNPVPTDRPRCAYHERTTFPERHPHYPRKLWG
jgi:hypothetical protein